METQPITLWLPHIIYSDKHLSGNAKLILTEILNLLRVDRRHCWASNNHFAKLFGLSRTNVIYHLQLIEKQEWIVSKSFKDCTLEYCDLRNKGWHRHIVPGEKLSKILDGLTNPSQITDKASQITDKASQITDKASQITDKASQTARIISNTYKYTKSKDTNVSLGHETKRNKEIDEILDHFDKSIGHIPSDKHPRRIAHNIRQITYTFIKEQGAVFKELRGQELTFSYCMDRGWQWYRQKEYCDTTEKLETFKLKYKVFLSDIARKLIRERRDKEYATEKQQDEVGRFAEP